ncbi:MAG: hypothetical protein M3R03_07480 [Pseudomonadota bacterium]|nr:hypothetical protein [Pseudomonadota bacterium]
MKSQTGGAGRTGEAVTSAKVRGPNALITTACLAGADPGDDPEIKRISVDEFRVRGGGKDGQLIFRRHGLGWKLSGVDLPAV